MDPNHRYQLQYQGMVRILQLGLLYRNGTTRGFMYGYISNGWEDYQ
ncbi:MAG: hypothetical protein AABW64_01540 [Nanoarchaeota archaeon]